MPGLRASSYTGQQSLERVVRLAQDGLDVTTFLSEAGAALDRAVPSGIDPVPAATWMTLDPSSLLITAMFSEGCTMPMSTEELVRFEYASQMPANRVGEVVRDAHGIRTLRQLVENDPDGASEYVELLRTLGCEHEVLVALRTSDGEHWGAVYLAREPGQPDFTAEELDLLRLAAPYLAEDIRRGVVLGEASEPEGPHAPAIVMLTEELTAESLTPGAQKWLADLRALEDGALPPAVLTVAQTALNERGGHVASARVLSEFRGWVMVHGQVLRGSGDRRVAVTIQPAGPDRITPLLMAAYGLTEREEEVTRHVLHGASTAEIADALGISPYTVQEHVKNIFEKTSARSRRELVGRVFARHYQPRVEDNAQRVKVSKPIRGGPFTDRSTAQVGKTHRLA